MPIASTDQIFSRLQLGNEVYSVDIIVAICRGADDMLSDKVSGSGPDNK